MTNDEIAAEFENVFASYKPTKIEHDNWSFGECSLILDEESKEWIIGQDYVYYDSSTGLQDGDTKEFHRTKSFHGALNAAAQRNFMICMDQIHENISEIEMIELEQVSEIMES